MVLFVVCTWLDSYPWHGRLCQQEFLSYLVPKGRCSRVSKGSINLNLAAVDFVTNRKKFRKAVAQHRSRT